MKLIPLLFVMLLVLAACTPSPSPYIYTIDVQTAQARIAQDAVLILDVRTQGEFASGHIPNAIHIPYHVLATYAQGAFPDMQQPILVYCQSGRRSLIAADTLQALGYYFIYNLSGGIQQWDGTLQAPVE